MPPVALAVAHQCAWYCTWLAPQDGETQELGDLKPLAAVFLNQVTWLPACLLACTRTQHSLVLACILPEM